MSRVVHLYFGVLDHGRAITARLCGRYSTGNTNATASIENCTCMNCLRKLRKFNIPAEVRTATQARLNEIRRTS